MVSRDFSLVHTMRDARVGSHGAGMKAAAETDAGWVWYRLVSSSGAERD